MAKGQSLPFKTIVKLFFRSYILREMLCAYCVQKKNNRNNLFLNYDLAGGGDPTNL